MTATLCSALCMSPKFPLIICIYFLTSQIIADSDGNSRGGGSDSGSEGSGGNSVVME